MHIISYQKNTIQCKLLIINGFSFTTVWFFNVQKRIFRMQFRTMSNRQRHSGAIHKHVWQFRSYLSYASKQIATKSLSYKNTLLLIRVFSVLFVLKQVERTFLPVNINKIPSRWQDTQEIAQLELFTHTTKRKETLLSLDMVQIINALEKIRLKISIVVRWHCNHAEIL